MGYRNLAECVADLESSRHLVRIEEPVDPHLEMAEIHRRVVAAGGPALYFARVHGTRFPAVSNLFGTLDRARYLFRDTWDRVRRMIELRVDPSRLARAPWRYLGAPRGGWHMLPRHVRRGAVTAHRISLDELPQITCWPGDGGPFITLPLVYTEDPDAPGPRRSNLGMYRVQLAGNEYRAGAEVGLHYQIHRGIGVHHAAALRRGERLRVQVFVGGTPAMMLAAVMPLPEGLSELGFAGALSGRRVPLLRNPARGTVYAEADFCLTGTVDPQRLLPEGPFGDHLGYYARRHPFPVLEVEQVTHRAGAIWPFTVVGRPPQEDSIFGQLIHELTGPVIPTVVPGVHSVHAVDAAGVHPLLLAVGSERYTPYAQPTRPQEILTQANAILGQGQMSLAKYLFIVARQDAPQLDAHDVAPLLTHVLERFDPLRDLHFQTCTTIDTLDYTGDGLNQGSKLVWAAVGPARRDLPSELPVERQLPHGFSEPRLCLPGVVAIQGPPHAGLAPTTSLGERLAEPPRRERDPHVARFCRELAANSAWRCFPLLVVVDDSDFTARSLDNFLWVTFTRSNPAADIYGVDEQIVDKHWGCRGPVVIDARTKPHHAPPLEVDAAVARRVERLALAGQPLAGIL